VEWDRTITDALKVVSPLRRLATVQTISGRGFTKLFNDRTIGSGWVGETAARPATSNPQLSSLEFGVGEIYANPAATQQLLDDSEVNIEAWLANEVETEFARQEGIAFLTGNGTNKPHGLMTYITGGANDARHPWGAIEFVETAANSVIGADDIVNLIYDLPSELTGNARFAMNRNTMSKVRLLKDGQNNYLWQPTFVAGQPSSLAGYPLEEMADLANVADAAFPVLFGDFKRTYLVIDRLGIRVMRDPYTNKPYVMFYTTKRVGGGVQDPTAMRALKINAA
jgi:HK97 family phage major capsid protein